MAVYSQVTMISEMEKMIAVSGADFRNELYDYVTNKIGLSNAQATSILQGESLWKFSNKVLIALAEFMAPAMGIQAQEACSCFKDVDDVDPTQFVERKKKFLKESGHKYMASRCNKTFNHLLTVYELKYKKDICEATKEELIDAISSGNTINYRTMQNVLPIIRHYIEWCVESGLCVPHKDELLSLKPSDVDIRKAIASKLVSGPKELCEILTRADGLVDARTIICAVLVWLGVSTDELPFLLDSDVSIEDHKINTPYFGVVDIPDCLIKFFVAYQRHLSSSGDSMFEIEQSDKFLKRHMSWKEINGTTIKETTIRQNLSSLNRKLKVFPDTCYDLTSKGLYMSGSMWRLYNIEKASGEITDEDIIRDARISFKNRSQKIAWKRIYKAFKSLYSE